MLKFLFYNLYYIVKINEYLNIRLQTFFDLKMNPEDNYEELICGLTDDQHFVRNPIVLPDCGHSACKNCLPNKICVDLKCKICGTLIERDLSDDKESIGIKRLIKIHLNDLHSLLEKQTNEHFNRLKSIISSLTSIMD